MSIYLKSLLESEIILPSVMDNIIGRHYNNALYNGVTWLIFILHVIHFTFDCTVNALLRKMRFKEYIRLRLKKSLWYLGFYSCSFLYCGATLWKNNIKLPNRYKFTILDLDEPISGHLILGYALLISFYASSSMWEGLHCSFLFFTYLFLFGFVAFTYFLRYIELAILLASTFSLIQVMTEFTRCLFCMSKGDLSFPKLLANVTFFISVVASGLVYFVIIPASFILPLARGLIKNPNSITMAGLNLTVWGWLVCEIYTCPIYRLIQHRWYHGDDSGMPNCVGSIIECALFFPRNDTAYNFRMMKQEVKQRHDRLIAMRKPRGASALMQTLKCVAAINKKIKYRRLQNLSNDPSGSDFVNVQERDLEEDRRVEEPESESEEGDLEEREIEEVELEINEEAAANNLLGEEENVEDVEIETSNMDFEDVKSDDETEAINLENDTEVDDESEVNKSLVKKEDELSTNFINVVGSVHLRNKISDVPTG